MAAGEAIGGYLAGAWHALAELFSGLGSFLSPLPLLVAFAMGVPWAARAVRESGRKASAGAVLGELVPARVWKHRSTWHDIAIVLINEGLLFFIPAAIASGVFIAHVLAVALTGLGDAAAQPAGGSWPQLIGFTIWMTLVWDFAATWAHYLKHRIPFLWEFHKVHHSAAVLGPLTAMRRHPVELIASHAITGLVLAAGGMLWLALFGLPGSALKVGGLVLGVWIWRVLGYNLRHMHLWIEFGPFWRRWLMSPAHHMVHHSNHPEHHDTNFGHIFTFWDRLFGTLYDPARAGQFELGIAPEEMKELNTLKALYLVPLRRAFRRTGA